ncbi:thiamine pyrophosphate-binding protein [Jatrophihabitans sp. DSM 45814]
MSQALDDIASAIAETGITRVYGLPGGGTSRLLGALRRAGIEFVLSHSETGAVFMAATEAEQLHRPAVALTSLGPGTSAAVNGLAHCLLDRVPVILISDRLGDSGNRPDFHQYLDHSKLLGGVVKTSITATVDLTGAAFRQAVAAATDGVPGPVHLDLPGNAASWPSVVASAEVASGSAGMSVTPEVYGFVAAATRPVILAGLGATALPAGALDAVAVALRAPVLTTYKGKGAISEFDDWSAGIVTGGVAEAPLLEQADLLITIGLDAIELLPAANALSAPRVDISTYPLRNGAMSAAKHVVVDDLAAALAALPRHGASTWESKHAREQRASVNERFAATAGSGEGLHPWEIVSVAHEVLGDEARLTVDAGAHMLPVCQGWLARSPGSVSISNGLATMAYALPAAVARSIIDPAHPVVCFTGDGGLLMAAAELATAARLGGRIVIVVFDDGALSLIEIKQTRDDAGLGVRFARPRWTGLTQFLGLRTVEVDSVDDLRAALESTRDETRPVVIAVRTDPAPYKEMLEILRG